MRVCIFIFIDTKVQGEMKQSEGTVSLPAFVYCPG